MIIKLVGKKIELVEYSKNDINSKLLIRYAKWLKNKKINKYLKKKTYKKKNLEDFIKKMINSKNDLFFKIVIKNNNIHIGNVRLSEINFKSKKSNFGIMLGDLRYHNKGYAKETLVIVMKFLFEKLMMKKLEFKCVKKNTSAMNLYRGLGFRQKINSSYECIFYKTHSDYFK